MGIVRKYDPKLRNPFDLLLRTKITVHFWLWRWITGQRRRRTGYKINKEEDPVWVVVWDLRLAVEVKKESEVGREEEAEITVANRQGLLENNEEKENP